MDYLAFIVLVYLVAAIPFARCISSCFGVDICKEGSGNIGATNVTRVIGLSVGSVVFILDFLKAAVPVFIAIKYGGYLFGSAVGFTAVFAHIFSVYIGFKGGKGVAPMMGVYFALSPVIFALAGCVWVGVFSVFRKPFIASLSACTVGTFSVSGVFASCVCIPIFAATLLIFFKHASNVRQFMESVRKV